MNIDKFGVGDKSHLRPIRNPGMMARLCAKYGADFYNDIDALFWRQFWTMSEVGTKYNLSRERVRQVFNAIYGVPFRPIQLAKSKLLKNDLGRGCQLDPLSRAAVHKPNKASTVGRGLGSEAAVQKIANELGMETGPSPKKCIDLRINGHMVEVKSYQRPTKTSLDSKTEYYRFVCSKRQVRTADFFIFHAVSGDMFYIIPSGRVSPGTNYISDGTSSKFEEYRERWDLLL